MKPTLLLITLFFVLNASSTFGNSYSKDKKTPVTLTDTYYFDLKSTITNKNYRIFVSEPETHAPKKGYSVLYSLDGNATIPLLSRANLTVNRMAKIRQARKKGGGNTLEPGLIVAIGYTDASENIIHYRAEDYTPAAHCNPCDKFSKNHGGADLFLKFIQQELKPEIAKRYPINKEKSYLFGHSYGGLFAVYAAMTEPSAFSKVYAVSPSFWYGNEVIFDYTSTFADKYTQLAQPLSLFLSSGEWEEFPEQNTPPARLTMLKKRAMVSNLAKFTKLASPDKIEGLTIEAHTVSQQDHGTMMFQAAMKVTRQAFTR